MGESVALCGAGAIESHVLPHRFAWMGWDAEATYERRRSGYTCKLSGTRPLKETINETYILTPNKVHFTLSSNCSSKKLGQSAETPRDKCSLCLCKPA